jgi:transporter family-2 protein
MNIFLATLVGVLLSFMVLTNGTLAGYLGNYPGTVVNHAIGLSIVLIILFFKKIKVKTLPGAPLYIYLGGGVGVFTVLFTNLAFNNLGMSRTLALGLLGQSIASIIIDHFGLLGMPKLKFNIKKSIGLSFVGLGIFLMDKF